MQTQVSGMQKDHDDAVAQRVRSSVRVPSKLGSGSVKATADAKIQGRVQQTAAKTKSGVSTLTHMNSTCSQLRRTHYKTVLPTMMRRLQDLEVGRCDSVVRCMTGWSSGRQQHLQPEFERSEMFAQLVKSCDTACDLRRFVALNEVIEAAVPATALVECTLRGVLPAVAGTPAEVKTSVWKPYLFVLYVSFPRGLFPTLSIRCAGIAAFIAVQSPKSAPTNAHLYTYTPRRTGTRPSASSFSSTGTTLFNQEPSTRS
jgi:hypothetical protein